MQHDGTKNRIAPDQNGKDDSHSADEVLMLSRCAMDLVELSPDDDVFHFIGERLLELAGDCYIVVNSFDEATGQFCLRHVLGARQPVQAIARVMGRHPVGLSVPIRSEGRRGLTTGRLELVPGGLYEIGAGSMPRRVCRGIEMALGVAHWHAIGFAWRGQLFGSAIVATRKPPPPRTVRLIEAFIKEASVALQRWLAEEALRKAHADLEQRVEERTRELSDAVSRLEAEIAERAKAEEQLKRERTARDAIVSLNPYAISMYDSEGHFTSGNQAFQELFGSTPPSDYSLFTDPILLANGYLEELLKLKKGEAVPLPAVWYNPHLVRADVPDAPRYVRGVAFPIKGGGDEIRGIVAMHEDVSESTRRDEELHLKDCALAASINAIALADSDGRLTYVNAAFLKLWGYDDDKQVIGRPSREFWQASRNLAGHAGAKPGGWRGEAIGVNREGAAFVVELSASVVTDGDGQPGFTMASFIDVTERRRLEDVLRESEELSRGMLSAARAAVYIVQDGCFLYVNPQFEQITGRAMAELSGAHCLEHVHPDDRKAVRQKAVEQLKGQSTPPYEFRYMCKDGRTLHLMEKVASIMYKGKPTTVGSFMDVTDLKRAQDELSRSEERYRSLIETAGAGVATVDHEGRLAFVNGALCAMVGRAEDELLGEPVTDLVHADDRPKIAGLLGKVSGTLLSGRVVEFRAIHRDGHVVWCHTCPTMVRREDGTAGFNAIIHDVTERKLLEDRFRSLIEHAFDVIEILDESGIIQYASPAVESGLGYKPEEVLGQNARAFLHPDDAGRLGSLLAELVEDPGGTSRTQFRCRHKDGSWRHLAVVGQNHLDDPAVAGIVVNARDITESKLADEAVRRSQRELLQIVDGSSIPMFVVNSEHVVTHWNRACENLTGMLAADVVGTSEHWAPFYPESRPLMADLVADNVPQGEMAEHYNGRFARSTLVEGAFEAEGFFPKLGEQGKWLYFTAAPLRDDDGHTVGAIETLHDTTDRRRAEEDLFESEEKYRHLFGNAQAALYRTSVSDGRVLECNEVYARLLGYDSREQCLAERVASHHYLDHGTRDRLLRQLREQGEIRDAEVEVTRRDGTPVWLSYSARLYAERDCIEGAVIDITESKKAQEALRLSEERYRLLIENANEAIIVAQDGAFKYANAKAGEMTGLSLEELAATPFMDVIHPDDRQLVAERHMRRLQGEEFEHVYSFRMVDREGNIKWVQINAVLMEWQGRPATLNLLTDVTEKKEAENQLRESESRYRLLAENVTDVIWTLDDKLKYTYLSPSVERLLGFTVEEACAKTLEDRLTPDSLGVVRKAMEEELLKAGPPYRTTSTMELEQYRKDGSTVWTEASMTLLRDANDEVQGMLGITRDISERKQAEEAVRESEARFRRFVGNAPDITFRWSVEEGLEYVSASALRVTGYTPEELLTDPELAAGISRARDLDMGLDYRQAAAEGHALPPREFAFARRGGGEAYLEIRAVPLVDGSGELTAFEGILRDITERKQVEEALRRSEEFSSSLLANAPSAILVVNPDSSIRYVNPALEELTGFSAGELMGSGPPYPWWTVDALERTGRDLMDAIPRGARGLEQLYRKKNGEDFWVELTAVPIIETDGELKYHLVTWVDITERKQGEEALRHSEYKYRTAIESARDGVLILNRDWVIVDANRMSVSSVGYDYKEQLVGRSIADVVDDDTAGGLGETLRGTLEKHGYLANLEVTARTRDARSLPVQVNISQVLDRWGEPTSYMVVVRDVSERKRAEEAAQRYTRNLEALHAISIAVSQTLDLDEMLESALDKVLKVTGTDAGYIHLFDAERRELVLKAHRGLSERYVAAIETMGVSEEAMKRWHDAYPEPAFRMRRILSEPSFAAANSAGREESIHTSVAVPLWSKSVMHGGLTLVSHARRRFKPEELELLEAIGNEIAVGIENAKLLERTKELSATDELTGLYNRRQFFELLEGELNRMHRYGGSFTLAMVDLDEFKEYNDRFGHSNGDALLRSVAQALRSELRKPDMAFRYGGDEFTIILPETDAEKAKGIIDRLRLARMEVLQTDGYTSRLFLNFSAGIAEFPQNAETADGLVFLADTALYHSKRAGGNRSTLVSDLGELAADVVDSATMDQVYALAATVDARDPHTYGHSKRVATVSEMIGTAIGLRPKQISDLRAGALLHDIGKVGVPDSILTKPDRPSEPEWMIIRKHPVEGAKIVGYVKELEGLVPLIRHHHEWYDGSGYPDGLRGEKIPLGARIISVADAYDTMTTPRPYRQVVSSDEACRELERCSGTQFDPRLVKAFQAALKEKAQVEARQAEHFPL
ncbi:MAG: PAS domain S-box protein [Chloroflexota bacterium]|nr:PAS domain S-box protein [Chloroflexota bacterium]